ncbi:MAG: GAF domain-containing protein [Betaproteobacteria bacterium]|nr:GAF domain-containing protein [Betaproteobacteria bacterium]
MSQNPESHPPIETEEPPREGVSGTMEFLIGRMRRNGDFPALSSTISAVSKAAASEMEGISALAGNILKDFSFTQKLLKLVNTAHFGRFGGTVSTISRAIMVMGFDQIRTLAVTLLLFEHLQNNAQADDLKDEVLSAYFSALIARDLVSKAGVRNSEDAFICAMFSRLGKLLVTFYLYDERLAIERAISAGASEESASIQVLGISYSEAGMGVASSWGFPDKLVASMRPLPESEIRKPAGDTSRLCVLSELSSSLTQLIRDVPLSKRQESVKAMVARFGKGLGITEQHLDGAVLNTVNEIARDAGILNFRTDKSALFDKARKWSVKAKTKSGNDSEAGLPMEAVLLDGSKTTSAPAAGAASGAARQAILSAGFQDISNALVGDFNLNDVLRIILETMYRGLGFTRTILCALDPKSDSLKARFGFGQDVDQIIRAGFSISLSPARDVFHAAISKGADIYIDDVQSERIRDHIPGWYQQLIPAKSFALFPVMIAKKPVGLFYGDANTAKSLRLEAGDMAQLKTLRNQAVLAIKSQSA